MAQRISLHRDGSLLGLSPFDIEIRSRIWWCLLFLDGQTSEFCGAGLSIFPPFDAKPPLNINETDLSPGTSVLPATYDSPTEMTLSCPKYETEQFFKDW